MSATPASKQSLYFDAPMANSHSPASPAMKTDPPAFPGPQHDVPNDVHLVADTAPTEASKDGVVVSSSRSNSPPIDSPSRSMFTNAGGQAVNGSTFIAGAATTGPNSTAEADGNLHRRAASADASLTPKQRSKIEKSEGTSFSSRNDVIWINITTAKDSKRLSKIIKEEAKAEKKALSVALTELAEIQKLQKQAIKVS
jgi:hypothetical protein